MPSHHSSSSHSSHSSSHHSSSHHSSSHSHSSHSSSYHSSSSHSRSSYISAPVYRSRTNQPTGYHGSSPKIYRCKTHDYSYYPDSWTDSETGKTYQAGYYDEFGNFYEDVVVTPGGVIPTGTKVLCHCEFCDSKFVREWQEGELACPNCGGTVKVISHMDEAAPDSGGTYMGSSSSGGKKWGGRIAGIVIAVLLAPCFLGGLLEACEDDSDTGTYNSGTEYSSTESTENSENTSFGDKMFLKKSGDGYEITTSDDYSEHVDDPDYKRLVLDDEGNYYDSETEGYAYYNTDLSPVQFQYWFEGISSDYGEYGWMEYDEDQKRWYIEASEGNWVVLPDSYDQSRLWYIKK